MSPIDNLADDQRKKLEQVRKLQAKATAQGTTPEEAEAFLMKAAEVLDRYSLDESMLASLQEDGSRFVVGDRKLKMEPPYATAKAHLMNVIAQTGRCKCIRLGSGANIETHLYGSEADLDRADWLFTNLEQTATLAMLAAEPRNARQVKSFRRSFLLGFANRIYERLQEIEKHTKEEAAGEYRDRLAREGKPSVELVLASQATKIEAAYAQAYPKAKKFQLSVGNHSGYWRGDEAGQRADLGTSKLGGRSRGVLGS